MRIGKPVPPGSLLKPDKSTRIKKKTKDTVRPGNDPAHLECIRQLKCCIPTCNKGPRSDPHHLKCTGERGMGQRSTDKWTIPLCRGHHDEVERFGSRKEVSYFSGHGLDPIYLAMSLWFNSKDQSRMEAVVATHKELGLERKEEKNGTT